MTPQLIKITPTGEFIITVIEKPPKLETLQEIVGGAIEVIPLFSRYDNKPCVAFCNEEGKLEGLTYNPQATLLWYKACREHPRDILVGSIAIVVADPEFLRRL